MSDEVPLDGVRDQNGNTALHLLCCGKFDEMVRLLQRSHKVSAPDIQHIESYTRNHRCGCIVETLLNRGCSIVTVNANNQTALQVLLSDFRQVYIKRLTNIDYVQILNAVLERHLHVDCVVKTLCTDYMAIVRHFVGVNEEVSNDMKKLLVFLRNLDQSSLKEIVKALLKHAFSNSMQAPDSEDEADNIAEYFAAVLDGMPEEKLTELFSDSGVKETFMTVLKGRAMVRDSQFRLTLLTRMYLPGSGRTLLHEFVCQGDGDLIDAFLALDPSSMSELVDIFKRRTPLYYCRVVKSVEHLHKFGRLKPALVDLEGQTALMHFAKNGLFAVGRKLLSWYRDVDLAPRQIVTGSVLFSIVSGVTKYGNWAEAVLFLKDVSNHTTSSDVNQRDTCGRTALMTLLSAMAYADLSPKSVTDCRAIALHLISRPNFDADAVDVDERSTTMYVLSVLTKSPVQAVTKVAVEIFGALCEKSTACFDRLDKHGRNLLMCAINELINCQMPFQKQGLEQIITTKIVPKTNVNATDSEERSALVHAVCNQSVPVVKYLLENGANVNQMDKMQETAGTFAFLISEEILTLLLAVPTLSLTIADKNQQSLVHKLAGSGKENTLVTLLTSRSDICLMDEDRDGNFPVYLAIQNETCSVSFIKELILDKRFSILARNRDGKSVVDLLDEHRRLEACLLDGSLAEKFIKEIRHAVWDHGTLAMARKMTGVQAAQDKRGMTAMMYAVTEGLRCTDFGLVTPETVNLEDKSGLTVIHYMLLCQQYMLLQTVMQFDTCNIYARDTEGTSAVLKAALTAPSKIVKLFIEHPQFDVQYIEKEPTATTLDRFVDGKRNDSEAEQIYNLFLEKLEEAVTTKEWEAKLVKMFLKVPNCTIDTCDRKYGSALNYAVMTRNMKLALDVIRESMPDVSHKGTDGNTPLMTVVQWLGQKTLDQCSSHEKQLLVCLLEHENIDLHASSDSMPTALLVAINNNNDSIIEKLLACPSLGLHHVTFSIQRFHLCEHIIKRQSTHLLKALLRHPNFELNAPDCSAEDDFTEITDGTSLLTALVEACWHDGLYMLLDRHDLRFDVEDRAGRTPLMHAIRKLSADAVRKMIKHHNCHIGHINRFGQNASTLLGKLFQERNDTSDTEAIQSMVDKYTGSTRLCTCSVNAPKNQQELQAALEKTVEGFKTAQRNGVWSLSEREEVKFLIDVFVQNVMGIDDPERHIDQPVLKEHQRKYLQHYNYIVAHLDVGEIFLASLVTNQVLTFDQCDLIRKDGSTKSQRAKLLLRKLMFAGATGYQAFQEATQRTHQQWIVEAMEESNSPISAILQQLEQAAGSGNEASDRTPCTSQPQSSHSDRNRNVNQQQQRVPTPPEAAARPDGNGRRLMDPRHLASNSPPSAAQEGAGAAREAGSEVLERL